ncbi:LOW QUALITY PROTEIN: 5'-3' exonuclease PLD3 [Scomber scombrus]|uniref:LOW QUALITY PROTEIN: 5'-3' exonuclease PLD3 n=1 Tax=Scomber scombrus TaxID=13677 RepID=A0AAV1PZJ4_SCOSC
MPMVLRSRKSVHYGDVSEEELEGTAAPTTPHRSTRLVGSTTYEDTDESDSESVQSRVMETQYSGLAELEEEAAEEADVTDLKHCSVVLDRLTDDKAAKKELEEREDMNRKGGKPVSRIPTFHNRRSGASQNSEPPNSKKDTAIHVVQPPEKAEGVEASKSKLPDVREKALPQPSLRTPRIGFEASSLFSGTDQAAATAPTSLITTPKTWSLPESLQQPPMTVSPRPAIRNEHGAQQHPPEQDESKNSEIEADIVVDAPVSHLPLEDFLIQKPQEADVEVKSKMTLAASGDTAESQPSEVAHIAGVGRVETIMDEEPPWEKEPASALEFKDSRSSSEVECEDDLTVERSKGNGSGKVKEHYEPYVCQSELQDTAEKQASMKESAFAKKEPVKAKSTKSTKSSGCSSFSLFCFLPTVLLLLGGFGQHVWHYGLPVSVVQLTAQLELHWLEGFGLAQEPCSIDCRVHLVESIPEGLYPSTPSTRRSIADSWLSLLNKAKSSVDIAAFYLTLRASDLENADYTDSQGRKVFEQLKQLESKGVKLQVAVNAPQTSTKDTAELAAAGADVREVDLKAVTGGIVHTKLWVVDQKHLYLGSANMDWRSLSQVKEVGLSVEDCSCLAQDAFRIFGVYWSISGSNSSLPPYWPARLSALTSAQNPLHLKFNGVPAQVYLSSSPPQISARGRSDDLTTILSVIDDAQKFIYISVMDYLPLSEFTKPLRFWPAIDSALRGAACTRGVQVRLLVSCWEHSRGSMFTFLQSLMVLDRHPLKCDIEVKIFTVPSTPEQKKIPYARVNHAKYMVTDRALYIGTSNWSENYFTQTAGVGLVVNQTGSAVGQGQQTVQSQAEELFLRDWRSSYSRNLPLDDVDVCPRGSH